MSPSQATSGDTIIYVILLNFVFLTDFSPVQFSISIASPYYWFGERHNAYPTGPQNCSGLVDDDDWTDLTKTNSADSTLVMSFSF